MHLTASCASNNHHLLSFEWLFVRCAHIRHLLFVEPVYNRFVLLPLPVPLLECITAIVLVVVVVERCRRTLTSREAVVTLGLAIACTIGLSMLIYDSDMVGWKYNALIAIMS